MISGDELTNAAYFYATEDANLYDATVQMTDRAYDLVHDVTTRSIDFWLSRAHSRAEPEWFLNLGCGTGAEALRLLGAFPALKMVCVDHSHAMINLFRAKLLHAYGEKAANNRVIFVEADFREAHWSDQVLATVSLHRVSCQFKVAVSVYALHHLEASRKSALYSQVFNLLEPNSLFVNSDLYSFGSPWLAQLAQFEEEQWIQQKFSNDGNASALYTALAEEERERLRNTWIQHLRYDNRPLPISAPGVSLREPLDTEVGMLRKAGFNSTEIVARLYQSAVVVSEKGR